MVERPDIYELLAQQKTSATTQEQLNKAAKSTFIDKSNIEFWSGIITVARAIGESRTFAHGLPIYDTGTIVAQEVSDGQVQSYTPTGTEIWMVQAINLNSTVAGLIDSDGNTILLDEQIPAEHRNTLPIYLTSSMGIFFNNGSGSPQTPVFSYIKVSL